MEVHPRHCVVLVSVLGRTTFVIWAILLLDLNANRTQCLSVCSLNSFYAHLAFIWIFAECNTSFCTVLDFCNFFFLLSHLKKTATTNNKKSKPNCRAPFMSYTKEYFLLLSLTSQHNAFSSCYKAEENLTSCISNILRRAAREKKWK